MRLPHLLDYLFEVGPVLSGGMGPAPLSNLELAAWCDLTGIPLTPWEARTLRALSRDYLAEMHDAEDPSRPPPWHSVEAEAVAMHVNDMAAAIRAMAKR